MGVCPKCGQAVEALARECPRCGVIVARARTRVDEPGPRARPAATRPGVSQARTDAVSPLAATARVAAAAVAAGALVLFWLNRPGTNEAKALPRTNAEEVARSSTRAPMQVPSETPSPDHAPPIPTSFAGLQRASGLSDDDWRFLETFSRSLMDPSARPSDPQLEKIEALYRQAGDPRPIKAALMEGYFRKSRDFMSARRFAEASSTLERLKTLSPQEPRIYEFETALRMAEGDWAGAEASSRRYEALAGEGHAGVSYALALALSRLDRAPEALSVLGRPAFEICTTGPVPATVVQACEGARALKAQLKGQAVAEAGKDLFQSNRFNVRFDGETQQGVARDVVFVLDRAYVRLADIYRHEPRTRIPVVLHSGEDYYTKTGAPRWSGGQYSSHDGRIQIPIRGLPTSLPREMENTLVHELSHAFVDDMSGGLIPKDLNEGLAQYMEGLRFEDLLSPNDLKRLATTRRADVMSFYMLSLVVSEQLVRSRGQSMINDVLLAMRETGSIDGGFRKVLGKPWDATRAEILETFWRRYS